MGKNIKVMPQTHLSTFPGKGRDTLRLKTQVFWLKQYGLTITKLRLSKFKSPTFSVKCSTA